MNGQEATPGKMRIRRYHSISLWVLAVALVLFFIISAFVTLSPPFLLLLYVSLLAVAVNAMWATMNVMIHRRDND